MEQHHIIADFSTSDAWIILSPIEASIKRKIEAVGTPLKEWDIQINYGIKTGCNDAFVIDTAKRDEILANCESEEERQRTEALIRPILRGRDIKRYSYNWAGRWLINTHNGIRGKLPRIDIQEYPAVKKHLDFYWHEISKREDQGDTPYNLRSCAYLEDFDKPKIIYKETTQEASFVFDNKGMYLDKTCFMLISKDARYLQITLSSKLFEFAYKRVFSSVELNKKGYQYNKHALLKLPILKLNREVNLTRENSEDIIFDLYSISSEEKEYINNLTSKDSHSKDSDH